MSDRPICPCEGFTHPRIPDNPPGLDSIAYRLGDFAAFRRALLAPLLDASGTPVEKELPDWHPAPNGDLTLQLLEWWAYLADILTFYNERIANEVFLRTALQPESVQGLIRLLGYRPRPGIGATGAVAAVLAAGARSAQLPQGMALQSKPAPGKQPQIFETDLAVTARRPDEVPADPAQAAAADRGGAEVASLLLKGEISGLKPGDFLLLLETPWQAKENFRWLTVAGTGIEKDPRGKGNTRVTLESAFPLWPGFTEARCRLLTPSQTAGLWSYGAAPVQDGQVHLDRLVKEAGMGQLLLFDPGPSSRFEDGAVEAGTSRSAKQQVKSASRHHAHFSGQAANLPALVSVSSYQDTVWYANAPDAKEPWTAPTGTTPPVAVLHTMVGVTPPAIDSWGSEVSVHYGWREVGQPIAPPLRKFSCGGGGTATLNAVAADGAAAPGAFPPALQSRVFLTDAAAQGVEAQASSDDTGSSLSLSVADPDFTLQTPLSVLFNLVPVSRGKSVSAEVLGSGDAGVSGQLFQLKNSPLTYFQNAESGSGDNYQSTLRVWVDGIEWREVPSFYGRGATERVFVTREDEKARTTVLFGDGVNGSRLPSGNGNVIASYRYGSGAEAPAAGTLTTIMQPQPGLKAIRNPVAIGGGADPDPPARIRSYAPRSVLTFGRAVSADDYEVIAAQGAGVRRVRSVYSFDAASQRAQPVIYVGDDDQAVAAARRALALAADPNRPFTVLKATRVPMRLELMVVKAAEFAIEPVKESVTSLLTDPDTGLFGQGKVGIGEVFFRSGIEAVCLQAPGVTSLHQVKFWMDTGGGAVLVEGTRYHPGATGYFALAPEALTITVETVQP